MPRSIKFLPLLLVSLSRPLLSSAVGELAEASPPEPALKPYVLTYKAIYNGIPITATRKLHRDQDGRYIITSRAKNWLGKIEETGVFQLDASNAIVNDSYLYQRRIFGRKKTEQLTFDHAQGEAVYKSKKKRKTTSLAQPFHSRLSYQTQLRRDLINGKQPLIYPTLARGKEREYRFAILGEEVLDTDLGKITTVKLARVRENSSRETVLWFAKDWDYLLVKLWQKEEDGEDYQITLKEGSLAGVPLSQLEPAN